MAGFYGSYQEYINPVRKAQKKIAEDIDKTLQDLESNRQQRETKTTAKIVPTTTDRTTSGWEALLSLKGPTGSTTVSPVGTQRSQGGPRGIRNHNWLNIRLSDDNDWQGEVAGTDTAFETFSAPEYGIRAAAKLVTNYSNAGLDTVSKIIGKWAPTNENDTQNYINIVASRMNIDPNKKIDVKDPKIMENLLSAMAFVENGQEVDRGTIRKGIELNV